MIPVLARRPDLQISQRPGTNFAYLGINMEDPILSKREVRKPSPTPPTAIPSSTTSSAMKLAKPAASSLPIIGLTIPPRLNTNTIPRKRKDSSTLRAILASAMALVLMFR